MSPSETQTISTHAGDFRVRHESVPDARRVVMIHGLSTSLHLWDDIHPPLSEAGIASMSLDVLGHGYSSKPTHLYSIQDHADSIVELMSAVGWKSAAIVGNSMGALIAFAMAARHPQLVEAVVAIGCPAWASDLERRQWIQARSQQLIDIETGLPREGSPLNDTEAAKAIYADRSQLGLWLMNSIWTTGTYDLMADIGSIRAPSLLLYGSNDWLLATGRNLQVIPGADLREIPDAGHHAPLDQPEVIAREIEQFCLRPSTSDSPQPAGQPASMTR